jgi:hypothetical protein
MIVTARLFELEKIPIKKMTKGHIVNILRKTH